MASASESKDIWAPLKSIPERLGPESILIVITGIYLHLYPWPIELLTKATILRESTFQTTCFTFAVLVLLVDCRPPYPLNLPLVHRFILFPIEIISIIICTFISRDYVFIYCMENIDKYIESKGIIFFCSMQTVLNALIITMALTVYDVLPVLYQWSVNCLTEKRETYSICREIGINRNKPRPELRRVDNPLNGQNRGRRRNTLYYKRIISKRQQFPIRIYCI